MDAEKISKEIREFILQSFPHQGKRLEGSTDLLNDWFVDSLGITMTVVFLEGAFKIDITGADVNDENFYSIETLTAFVCKKMTRQ